MVANSVLLDGILGVNSNQQGIVSNQDAIRTKQENPYLLGLSLEIGGGQGRDRTGDTRIFSPLLYQLSYLATEV